jgi:hypothetical protein
MCDLLAVRSVSSFISTHVPRVDGYHASDVSFLMTIRKHLQIKMLLLVYQSISTDFLNKEQNILFINRYINLDSSNNGIKNPIYHENSKLTSLYSDLIDFDLETHQIRLCLICKQNFIDVKSTGLCPKCDNYVKNYSVPQRTINVSPVSNYYPYLPTLNQNSRMINTTLALPRRRVNSKVVCSYCNHLNLLSAAMEGKQWFCSICRRASNSNLY